LISDPGAVFLDLTAAYDTVWLRGLHMKLLDTIPDKHMVSFIMEMLSNRSFRLHTSNGQSSRMRRLRNGVPQGSVLAPMLFNIYIHDLPLTTSRKYSYADDLGLSKDMEILCSYLKNWHLKLSVDKTVTTIKATVWLITPNAATFSHWSGVPQGLFVEPMIKLMVIITELW
uniref:Reverse transcriptase domain-containing protein n=1 Tax=Astyanax mexicanus TaxID=7994 RepID=A0A3B1IGG1_ASTMX